MKMIDIALKDLLRSFRSWFAVGMMIVAPLMLTGLIYLAFSGVGGGENAARLPDIRVAVVNLDQQQPNLPHLGTMVVDYLQDERMPGWLIVSEMDSEEAARAAIERQEMGVAVIIPRDFSAALLDEDARSAIQVLHDPTLAVAPTVVKSLLQLFVDGVSGVSIALEVVGRQAALTAQQQAAVAQAYMQWYTALQQDLNHSEQPLFTIQAPDGIAQNSDITANPTQDLLALTMAAQMIFFAFYTGAYSTTSLLEEKENGTLARLFATPTPRSTILAGKFLAVFFTVALQGLVVMGASGLAFGIDWGDPLSAGMVIVGQVMAAAGFGIFLVSLMRSSKQAGPVLGGALTVLGMLGGLFTVAVPMPAAFETLNLLTPHGWAVRGWRSVLSGASPAEVMLPLVVLLLVGIALFGLGARNFALKQGFGSGN
ncbi:MAG: ABC transporter permease [Anaerolineaceae bacterium]|jgi:ABC-2 type transport system permease protein